MGNAAPFVVVGVFLAATAIYLFIALQREEREDEVQIEITEEVADVPAQP
jgi:hypothetical protein